MAEPRAILIAGPTASGKSGAALALARELGGAVINADSMQVYRELRVLTARPTPAEEAVAPHLLYGVRPASSPYSAGLWLDDAARALATVRSQGLTPIFVGGTGLYFRALVQGLAQAPEIPDGIRAYWRARAADEGSEALHEVLTRRDPEMAARLRPSDPQRIARALEVLDATGRSLALWQADPLADPLIAPDAAVKFVIAPDRDELYRRCEARFDQMLEGGALAEAASLGRLGLSDALPAMRAIGVLPLLEHLRGDITLAQAADSAKTETRRYAKRQLTWARSNMIAWNWINEQDSQRMLRQILILLRKAY
jgi:tRNA dimethylallyltransferase